MDIYYWHQRVAVLLLAIVSAQLTYAYPYHKAYPTSVEIIWRETFQDTDSITSEMLQSSWITINDNIDKENSVWETVDNKFRGRNLDGIAYLKTEAVNILEFENVSISIDLEGNGPMEPEDFLNVFYRLDNGPQIPLTNGSFVDAFGDATATATGLNGRWLEIIVEARNSTYNEEYTIDNIIISGTPKHIDPANIWFENFNGFADGTTVDNGSTAWSRDASNTNLSTGRFDLRYDRFEGVNLDAVSSWISEEIDITGFQDVTISMDVYGFGYLETNDCINVYYKLNNGSKVLLQSGTVCGPSSAGWTVDPVEAGVTGLSGHTLQLIAEFRNGTPNERFSIDNIRVSGIPDTPVTVTLEANDITCSSPTTTIITTVSENGLQFAWTGPNGYSSGNQNPTVNEAGEYELTLTDGGNIVATESIIINEDITIPDLTAQGGELNCNTSLIQLFASSTLTDVSYSWSGPDGFASNEPSPFVDVAGSYTITLTNTTNGCSNQQTVQVTEVVDNPDLMVLGGVLTCNIFSITLQANTSVSNPSFIWTGPNGFLSFESNPTVTETGIYSATMTDPATGCSVTKSAAVSEFLVQPGVSITKSDDITCLVSNPMLSATSPTAGVAYSWSGPGGFTSPLQHPTVSEPGWYTVTVTYSVNGCISQDSIEILDAQDIPDLTATGGTLSCNASGISIEAFSSVPGLEFEWIGPAGFTSTLQNPIITIPGDYFVSAFNPINGCSNSAVASVTQNTSKPNVSVTGGALSCDQPSINLQVVTDASSPTFTWTGPGSFTSSEQNPLIDVAGDYSVTVLDTSTGCDTTVTTTVLDNTSAPDISVENGVISCLLTSINLNANSTTPGATFSWTGPGGFSSTLQSPVVSEPGDYTVTVTDPDNGCFSSATASVILNDTKPEITAVGGTLNCDITSINLSVTTNATSPSFLWNGPDGFSSALQNPVVDQPGVYSVTVVDDVNGCDSMAIALVTQDIVAPDVTATGGEITCIDPNVVISASSATPGVTFNWTGPGGFSSTLSNPTVSEIGSYTVTVNNPVNGCENTAVVAVTQNDEQPGITATGGNLTCVVTEITLNVTTTATDPTFSWSGLDGFSSNEQNPTVDVAGEYFVTVLDNANGCDSTVSVIVTEDIDVPDVSATGGEITCSITNISIIATSTTPGVTYSWTGPGGFTSTLQSPVVSEQGEYTVTVTDPENGCFNNATASVVLNDTEPEVSTVGGALNCDITEVNLSVTTNAASPSFIWNGPGGFSSASQNPVVNQPGIYSVTVVDDVTGCDSTAIALVTQDIVAPDVTATGGEITCSTPNVVINASSATPGVSFTWNGPGGFTSSLQNPTVSVAGDYTVTVSSPANGCENTNTATVTQNTEQPGITATGGNLTCVVTEITLNVTTTATDPTFSWSGLDGFSSNEQNPTVDVAGEYFVTVLDNANGCDSTVSVIVTEDIDVPDVSTTGGEITCSITSISIIATSTTPGVTYSWTGPGGFTSTLQSPVVSEQGEYTVTVTDPENGCFNNATASVVLNDTEPEVSTVGGALNCDITEVNLSVTTNAASPSFIWNGPGGFSSASQNPVVNQPGIYSVTVVDDVTGCDSTAIALVTQDIVAPDVTAASGEITCSVPNVVINASSATPGVSFTWTGPGGFTSSMQNPTVSVAGGYTVTVSNPANGCENTATATVTQNTEQPGITATGGNLTCVVTEITLNVTTTATDPTFSWSGPGGFSTTEQNPMVDVAGQYSVTVLDNANGCDSTVTVTVTEDIDTPDISATGGEITCSITSINISASSTTPGVTYSWTGPDGFTSALQNPMVSEPGDYTVTVTDSDNGCFSSAVATVVVNDTKPEVSTVGGALNCDITEVNLSVTTNAASPSFLWNGPGGFSSALQNPVVNQPGIYSVTVVDDVTGCDSTSIALVTQDIVTPDVTATGGEISCSTPNVVINASSATPGVSFNWTGPGGFTSSLQNPTVSVAGDYTVTVSNPANGCENTATATVTQNTEQPGIIATGGNLTCVVTEITLNVTTTATDPTFSWSGPGGFSTTEQNPMVDVAGQYFVTVLDNANGCDSTVTVTVTEDIDTPDISATGGEITCSITSINISAASTTPGVTYSWTGPRGFTSTLQSPVVSESGEYTVTVTDPDNGCFSSAIASVVVNDTKPEVSTVGGALNCDITEVNLSVTTNAASPSFIWNGPGGFSSASQNPVVNQPGIYSVTVVDDVTGCDSTSIALVTQDIVAPDVTATGGEITCSTPNVVINASSATPGVSFTWTGPGGFTSSLQNPTVSVAGDYTVTVSNPANGCENTATATVAENTEQPGITATGGNLTCVVTEITLNVTTTATDPAFSWSGPGGFSTIEQNPIVDVAGQYFVTVLDNTNGCDSTVTVTVTEDIDTPDISATGGEITCSITSINISASSTTPGVTYSWTGPDGFTSALQNPVVAEPGDYTVIVTDPDNGCFSSAVATVTQDNDEPGVSASVSGDITCVVGSVTVTGNSPTAGVTFDWSGPNGFTSNTSTFNTSDPGNYILTITNPVNGCTSITNVEVIENTETPDILADDQEHTCFTAGGLVLTNSSSVPNLEYQWTVPVGFEPFFTDLTVQNLTVPLPFIVGEFTLDVVNPVNGCTNSTSLTVVNNANPPICAISLSGNELSVDPVSNGNYSWSVNNPDWGFVGGSNAETVEISPGPSGSTATVSVTIVNNENGCEESCSIELESSGGIIVSTSALAQSMASNVESEITGEKVDLETQLPASPTKDQIDVYPNPILHSGSILFIPAQSAQATVTIFSVNGMEKMLLLDEMVDYDRKYTINVSSEQLPNGLYICRIVIGENVYDRKVLIIKK